MSKTVGNTSVPNAGQGFNGNAPSQDPQVEGSLPIIPRRNLLDQAIELKVEQWRKERLAAKPR